MVITCLSSFNDYDFHSVLSSWKEIMGNWGEINAQGDSPL